MNAIYNEEGTLIQDQKKILLEQSKFYKKLYTSDKSVKFEYTNVNDKLDESECLNTNIPISLKELNEALKNMKNNKTPGCDGLPVEFYKLFWEKIVSFHTSK